MTGLSPSPHYEFQRPHDRAGVGPGDGLSVARHGQPSAGPRASLPRAQTIPAYGALEPLLENGGNPPAAAAHLNSNGFADVDEALAELAYETVRRDIRPSAPSRLDSVFCFFDPLEAFLFGDVAAQSGPQPSVAALFDQGSPG